MRNKESRQTGKQANTKAARKRGRQTLREEGRQAWRKADTPRGGKTDRHRGRRTGKQGDHENGGNGQGTVVSSIHNRHHSLTVYAFILLAIFIRPDICACATCSAISDSTFDISDAGIAAVPTCQK